MCCKLSLAKLESGVHNRGHTVGSTLLCRDGGLGHGRRLRSIVLVELVEVFWVTAKSQNEHSNKDVLCTYPSKFLTFFIS